MILSIIIIKLSNIIFGLILYYFVVLVKFGY